MCNMTSFIFNENFAGLNVLRIIWISILDKKFFQKNLFFYFGYRRGGWSKFLRGLHFTDKIVSKLIFIKVYVIQYEGIVCSYHIIILNINSISYFGVVGMIYHMNQWILFTFSLIRRFYSGNCNFIKVDLFDWNRGLVCRLIFEWNWTRRFKFLTIFS